MRPSARTLPKTTPTAFLQANSESYEWLVDRIQAKNGQEKGEAVLRRVEKAAGFACKYHPGRFADGSIENLAFEVGAELDTFGGGAGGFQLPVDHKESRRRVLHVATHVLGIGGHTRMLHHWVGHDQGSCHSVVLVDQRDIPVPQWLLEGVRRSGGDLLVLPQGSRPCQKAKWLRKIAQRNADLVVLHHDPCDVVPTVAFAVRECPPVVLLNHADHQFWLASSVSDMVINLRTAGAHHTVKRRFVSANMVVPIPLADQVGRVSKWDARRVLGIPEDQVMLLSVGRAEKYRPCGPYDFVSTARKILERQPSAHLYVVGLTAEGIAPYLRCTLPERMHLVGSMEDPSLYRAAADIYLESFPFGSNTALLEAALSGLPVVPAYAPLFPLLVAGDDALHDLLSNPENDQEYIERIDTLIQHPDRRVELGKTLRNRLLVDHVGEGWLHRLTALYKETDRLSHRPGQIPVSTCSMTNEDVGLSLWNVMANGKTNHSDALVNIEGARLNHTAFVAKEVGDYARARRFAWRVLLANPCRRATWRLVAVAVLGRAGRFIVGRLRQA